jgi:hypothetical protein
VDPRVGMDDLEKRKVLNPPGLEFRLLSRPAYSQSLYRLRYPGSSLQRETKPNQANGYAVFEKYKRSKGIPVTGHGGT